MRGRFHDLQSSTTRGAPQIAARDEQAVSLLRHLRQRRLAIAAFRRRGDGRGGRWDADQLRPREPLLLAARSVRGPAGDILGGICLGNSNRRHLTRAAPIYMFTGLVEETAEV